MRLYFPGTWTTQGQFIQPLQPVVDDLRYHPQYAAPYTPHQVSILYIYN